MNRPIHFLAGIALLSAIGASCGRASVPHEESGPAPRYDRDVRPILADRCFTCHGPDAKKRQHELRLDQRENALAKHADGVPIVPGKPEESEVWKRITHHDVAERMPPATSGKRPLSDAEKNIVRRWIANGAEWEPHWSFVPPVRPALPEVKDTAWVRDPLDRFILARLEQSGIAPSPEAKRETLLRRVFLDLTGLPPTPEELAQFLADARPDAYERWVDKLLESEPYRSRYAEHAAVPWLDAARYGDTNGIHTDAGRSIWPWRDWLLDSLREGMPFDRFVTEQIAGDLLPSATEEQKVASGFNRNHIMTDEGGAIAEEYLVEYAVDRVNTTSSVLMGLSMGCARCHDHKYDPFTQEDYYSLFAYFNSLEEPGLYTQLADPKRAFEPSMQVPTDTDRKDRYEAYLEIEALKKERDVPVPGEAEELATFVHELGTSIGLAWSPLTTISASSSNGAKLEIQPDGSVLGTGNNPDTDEHELRFVTEGTGLRLVAFEGLTDANIDPPSVGRARNGDAMLTSFAVEARSRRDPTQSKTLRFRWCWADFEQPSGDFRLANVLDSDPKTGWAADRWNRGNQRVAYFLADEPFGFEGGTELVVKLGYDSIFEQHVFAHEALAVAALDEKAFARLPIFASAWYSTGPFSAERGAIYATAFGPENDARLDLTRKFGPDKQGWSFTKDFVDGTLNELPDGINASYVAKRVYAPSARKIEASVGSDDGVRVFLNGREVFGKDVERTLAADQDHFVLDLPAGESTLVLKIVNTGGKGGFFWRTLPGTDELPSDQLLALLPESVSAAALGGIRDAALGARLARAWKLTSSTTYRALSVKLDDVEKRMAEIDARIPRTMVMKELAQPRPTYVLSRGQYDKADTSRPVQRRVPLALGKLPEGAPANRLGLAQWLVAPENPLVARVEANRIWESCFGAGLVRTSEDFGAQGERPSHPELLDYLAVELRESGWDVKKLLRRIVESATYRQNSRVRAELSEIDPDGRLFARYPRRRLGAEELRDQALYVSGLLVEKLGGPSVKPYQPPGLWQEIAMPASNTNKYVQGEGDDLWRRSLYTYWKRACPPPNLQTFDAPTRESCVVRRLATNTPLQSLVLWNDVQFVEAARALAQRVLAVEGSDREHLAALYVRAVGAQPEETALVSLARSLEHFRARYSAAEEDARKLDAIGMAPRAENLDARELAAWTMVASTLLNLDASLCRE